MPAFRLSLRVAGFAIAAALAVPAGAAAQSSASFGAMKAPWATDGPPDAADAPLTDRSAFRSAGQHGTNFDHLPAVRENVELVSKLRVKTPDEFKVDPDTELPDPTEPDVVPGQIADVAVYKNFAYLMSWSEPSCARGGFFSVDIRDPANPRQLAFVPALPHTYHGEGAHVITMNIDGAARDVLAVNDEPCAADGRAGFDLYDVTNPAAPAILVQGVTDATRVAGPLDNGYHSVFMWQAGGKSYLVASDNTEQGTTDVDIWDITNPRAPAQVADVDLKALAAAQGVNVRDNEANGNAIFNHDMIVKKIGNVYTLLVSYWDAGYVKVNVNDPANPKIIGDSAYPDVDPLTGFRPPEGNGHQSEFSHDDRYVLAADEDFSTYRTEFDITTGPNAGRYPSGEFGFSRPIASLPDQKLNGPTVFGGYGCTAGPPIPAADTTIPRSSLAAGEERIVVLQRGPVNDPSNPYAACRFDEKIQNAANAGYDAAIIANHHAGSQNGGAPDAALCGSGNPRDIPAMCIGHRAFHLLFNDTPDYDPDYTPNSEPAIGTMGEKVLATTRFDGWGYTHLFRNTGNDLEEIDSFAIEESLDERYATGFGDLSVHEFATDPNVNVAYSSYYAGGMRVFTFGEDGLTQTGKFIDDGGNNFWGVEVVTTSQGERLFAGSDRDYGLYLLRYTGPGAYKPPTTPPAPPGPKRGRCVNLLTATAASDRVLGTEFGDTIVGYSGDDLIDGRGGDDCINGLLGNDRLFGGSGVDAIDGERGNDRISGGSGRGTLRGGTGNDRVSGGSAADVVQGNAGRDRLFGGSGNDQLFGMSGADRITGGKGRDSIEGGTGNDVIYARDGQRDSIDCGLGRRDRALVDRKDQVTGCEHVSRR